MVSATAAAATTAAWRPLLGFLESFVCVCVCVPAAFDGDEHKLEQLGALCAFARGLHRVLLLLLLFIWQAERIVHTHTHTSFMRLLFVR